MGPDLNVKDNQIVQFLIDAIWSVIVESIDAECNIFFQ